MAKRGNRKALAKSRKEMWNGNSEELMLFLRRKGIALAKLKKDVEDKEQKQKLQGFINVIDKVLKLKYFGSYPIVSMTQLINTVKDDRAEILAKFDKYKSENEFKITALHNNLLDALHQSDFYMANSYEEEYNSDVQIKIREASEEYEKAKYEFHIELASYEDEMKVLDWLQGIIHHPVDFFKNAYTGG